MAHEILFIKLCQLDDRMARLHSRIHMSETADHGQLRREIDALEHECAEAEESLRENLRRSKSDVTSVLAESCGQIERIIRQSQARLQAMDTDNRGTEAAAEQKILLAEYALDFAHQAADRALLLSMDAIDAQLLQQQKGRTL